jgi:hypothetical protein
MIVRSSSKIFFQISATILESGGGFVSLISSISRCYILNVSYTLPATSADFHATPANSTTTSLVTNAIHVSTRRHPVASDHVASNDVARRYARADADGNHLVVVVVDEESAKRPDQSARIRGIREQLWTARVWRSEPVSATDEPPPHLLRIYFDPDGSPANISAVICSHSAAFATTVTPTATVSAAPASSVTVSAASVPAYAVSSTVHSCATAATAFTTTAAGDAATTHEHFDDGHISAASGADAVFNCSPRFRCSTISGRHPAACCSATCVDGQCGPQQCLNARIDVSGSAKQCVRGSAKQHPYGRAQQHLDGSAKQHLDGSAKQRLDGSA